jgi:hypothetical protein
MGWRITWALLAFMLVNLPGLKAGASVFGASGDVGECPASALTGGGVV